ncbi:hypothetical protein BH23CHL4_BH23CHL4_21510 [soil metagenome]
MDWQELVVIIAIGLLLLYPGYWLYRDAQKRGRNPLVWVGLYALAAVPPTRLRFILVPIVFGVWFLLRDRHFPLLKRIARMVPGARRKTPSR